MSLTCLCLTRIKGSATVAVTGLRRLHSTTTMSNFTLSLAGQYSCAALVVMLISVAQAKLSSSRAVGTLTDICGTAPWH